MCAYREKGGGAGLFIPGPRVQTLQNIFQMSRVGAAEQFQTFCHGATVAAIIHRSDHAKQMAALPVL